jgi:FixJ family two-component response regulator/signal transduction histidine kinase
MPSGFDEKLVATSLPSESQLRVIFGVLVLLIVALVIVAPNAGQTTHGTEIFLPAYAAAVFVIEITTAAILFTTFQVRRSVMLLILAAGYLLSAMLVWPWVVTFPGVFSLLGWDHDLQATARIAAIRRIGFAVALVGYALARPSWTVRATGRWVLGCGIFLSAFVAAVLLFILSEVQRFPAFMADARNTAPAWEYVPPLALVLYGTGICALLIRRRSTLDIWILVVLFSVSVEIILISYLGGAVRLSVGWWSGRIFGLVAAGTILLVLLAETTGNYTRLAEAAASERRARRNRMTAMEALSASIAHEVNQPLTSMVTNANAGLRWLSHTVPQVDQAQAALKRIVEEGHRADKVVSGIRAMFQKGAQDRVAVDLECLVDEALGRCAPEQALAAVEVVTDRSPGTKIVMCNPVQLVQVVSNLIENAIDAMRNGSDRVRRLTSESQMASRARSRRRSKTPGRAWLRHSRSDFSPFRLDQAGRHGHGAHVLPVRHRSAWRSPMGDPERADGGRLPFLAALVQCCGCPQSRRDPMGDDPIVYVIDDDPAVRASLESLLASVGYCVRTFASTEDFLDGQRPDAPACLVLDVRLKGRSGLEFQRDLARLGDASPIIFITGHGDVPMSVAAMKAGAIEFLTKPFRDQDLLDAVHAGIEGDRRRREEAIAVSAVLARYEKLSPRERQVMRLVASGLMNKQIADQLGLSEVTVKVHRAQTMQKLEARTLAELIRITDRLAPLLPPAELCQSRA